MGCKGSQVRFLSPRPFFMLFYKEANLRKAGLNRRHKADGVCRFAKQMCQGGEAFLSPRPFFMLFYKEANLRKAGLNRRHKVDGVCRFAKQMCQGGEAFLSPPTIFLFHYFFIDFYGLCYIIY